MSSDVSYATSLEAGNHALRAGDIREALVHFERAATLAQDDAEATEALCQLGRAHAELGQFAEAEQALNAGQLRAARLPALLARARRRMAALRWLQGQLDEARRLLQLSAAECQQLGLVHERAFALANLGLVLTSIGEYQQAISALQEALALHESLNDLPGVVHVCNNLGECYYDLGDFARAGELFQRGLTLSELLDMPALGIDLLRNLGRVQAQSTEHDQAAATLARALELAERYHRQDLLIQARCSLAEVQLLGGDVARAEAGAAALQPLVEDALTRRAEVRLILGHCALARGQGTAALEFFQTGLLDAQNSFGALLILRYHVALSQLVDRPDIAEVYRRIAAETAQRIADELSDPALRQSFLHTPLVRVLGERGST
jgi:tetratricopeptide (TPR) repeat protein